MKFLDRLVDELSIPLPGPPGLLTSEQVPPGEVWFVGPDQRGEVRVLGKIINIGGDDAGETS